MAKISPPSPLYGASGMIGGLIFRTYNGKTIVSAYDPQKASKRNSRTSPLQNLTRSRFAEATKFAKSISRDEEAYEYYKKMAVELGVTSAYTAAITDYMRSTGTNGSANGK